MILKTIYSFQIVSIYNTIALIMHLPSRDMYVTIVILSTISPSQKSRGIGWVGSTVVDKERHTLNPESYKPRTLNRINAFCLLSTFKYVEFARDIGIHERVWGKRIHRSKALICLTNPTCKTLAIRRLTRNEPKLSPFLAFCEKYLNYCTQVHDLLSIITILYLTSAIIF